MAEYIEREAEDYWCERCCNFDKENVGMDATAVCKLTGCLAYCQEYGGNCKGFNIPAADVVEVRHGEWGKKPWMDTYQHWCPLCLATVRVSPQSVEYKYCPYCGAKMDGKGE